MIWFGFCILIRQMVYGRDPYPCPSRCPPSARLSSVFMIPTGPFSLLALTPIHGRHPAACFWSSERSSQMFDALMWWMRSMWNVLVVIFLFWIKYCVNWNVCSVVRLSTLIFTRKCENFWVVPVIPASIRFLRNYISIPPGEFFPSDQFFSFVFPKIFVLCSVVMNFVYCAYLFLIDQIPKPTKASNPFVCIPGVKVKSSHQCKRSSFGSIRFTRVAWSLEELYRQNPNGHEWRPGPVQFILGFFVVLLKRVFLITKRGSFVRIIVTYCGGFGLSASAPLGSVDVWWFLPQYRDGHRQRRRPRPVPSKVPPPPRHAKDTEHVRPTWQAKSKIAMCFRYASVICFKQRKCVCRVRCTFSDDLGIPFV